MHIICPHCTTSYAINLATLGAAGRTVRCSRCKEVWLARPEDATELRGARACHGGSLRTGRTPTTPPPNGKRWRDEDDGAETPVVDSPSISADWPGRGRSADEANWPSIARDDMHDAETARPQRLSWFRKLVQAAGAGSRAGQIVRQSRHGLRRDGRAGAGADDLAGRRGAAAAANRRLLQAGRPRGKSARTDVQGRQDHLRDGGRQAGAGDRGRDHGRSQEAGPAAAAALQRSRRAGRGNLRLECGTGAARAEAGRTGLVQVAAGLAAARRPQYRCTLLPQAGYRRRQPERVGPARSRYPLRSKTL